MVYQCRQRQSSEERRRRLLRRSTNFANHTLIIHSELSPNTLTGEESPRTLVKRKPCELQRSLSSASILAVLVEKMKISSAILSPYVHRNLSRFLKPFHTRNLSRFLQFVSCSSMSSERAEFVGLPVVVHYVEYFSLRLGFRVASMHDSISTPLFF